MTIYKGAFESQLGIPFVAGDYIASPNGIYYANLQPTGSFVVSRGSDPVTSGLGITWSSPLEATATPPFTDLQLVLFTGADIDSAGVVFSAPGTNQVQVTSIFGATSPSSGNTYLSLSDTGTLAINAGNGPTTPGAQLWTNGFSDKLASFELAGLDYDLANATLNTDAAITGGTFLTENKTGTSETFPVSLSLAYSKTSTWNYSIAEAVTLSGSETTTVGVPGVADEELKISLSETTTLSSTTGGSTSESKTFNAGADVTVPAFSSFLTTLTAQQATFEVPYTYSGKGTYASGATATLSASGVFAGGDVGVFSLVTTCVSAPGGCPKPPDVFDVAEPGSALLLASSLLAAATIRRLGFRPRARASMRSEVPVHQPA